MKVLKSEKFGTHEKLTLFVNSNRIAREDILVIITNNDYWLNLFYYAEE